MFHRYEVAVNNSTGVPIAGVEVRVYDAADNLVPIYSDSAGTPILSVSGIADTAVSDDAGNYSYYVANGVYTERLYVGDSLAYSIPNLVMQGLVTTIQTPTFADAATITTSSDTNLVIVSGTSAVGDSGTGRQFAYDATVDAAYVAANPTTSFVDATGRGFKEIPGADAASIAAELSLKVATADLASTAAGKGAAMVEWLSSRASAVARTLADLFEDRVSIMDFIPLAERVKIRLRTSTADLSAYFEAAGALGCDVLVPDGLYNISNATITAAGARFVGNGPSVTTLRQGDTSQHMFVLQAARQGFGNLTFEGISTTADVVLDAGKFAIFTAAADPAPHMRLDSLVITGTDASHGFVNFAKFDTGSDSPKVDNIYGDRLWGEISGCGYFFLCGATTYGRFSRLELYATPGRGRHGVYLSGGASFNVVSDSHFEGFNFEAVPTYSTGAQNPCIGNLVARCTFDGCGGNGTRNDSSISFWGHCQGNRVAHSRITNSGGCGIKVDSSGYTDGADINLIDNDVIGSAFDGVDINSITGVTMIGGHISESSQSAAGTYPNIRLIGDGTTATTDVALVGVRSDGATFARSALQCNATAPVPSNIKISGCQLETCNAAAIEPGDSVLTIDGYIRKSTTLDPASLADGAAWTSTAISVPGAEVGDMVQVTHAVGSRDGTFYDAWVETNGNVKVSVLNKSGGVLDLGSATTFIDVFKRAP